MTGAEATPEPAPPEGQTYTGAKACASCHFEQFMAWSKSKHAKSFELVTAEYQTNEKCLSCHTTGYGEPSGFKDLASSKALAGTTCESCHGPGSKHDEIAKAYGKEKLTPEQEKECRDSIWMMLPGNVCVDCHTTQAHKPSETPDELKPK
jgi:nitrate/TMAO reductase-like tetraheme cytochrome c subunit